MSGKTEIIAIALSGGVDSAVAAVRLLRAGHRVLALHMTNWESGDEYCTAGEDYAAARRVADDLGLVLRHVNFAREYREQVFSDFLAEYEAGRTPNPDIACNRHIKFGALLRHARRLGATRLATGHYARIVSDGGTPRLFRAADTAKDQTYFLHAVDGASLAHAVFPIGELSKAEVRREAREAGLANHSRRDSTGICFIGERPFREFLAGFVDATPGEIVTPGGAVVGRHDGLPFYTPGQRAGLGIGGRAGGAELPWYVATRDLERNRLVVVQGRAHPLLWSTGLLSRRVHWINGAPTELTAQQGTGARLRLQARLRHRHEPAPCRVEQRADGAVHVHFDQPQWAIAPGQYVVFYDGEECLGGGAIDEVGAPAAGQERGVLAAAAPA